MLIFLHGDPGYVVIGFALRSGRGLVDDAGDVVGGDIEVGEAVDVAEDGDAADLGLERPEFDGHGAAVPAEADGAVDDADGLLTLEGLDEALLREGPEEAELHQADLDAFVALGIDDGLGGAGGGA